MSSIDHTDIPALRAPLTVVRVPRLRDFLAELRSDFEHVRHSDVRWQTETVTSAGIFYEMFTAGYIAEHGDPKLIEFRRPCGHLGLDRRAEDIAAQEQIACMLEEIQRVAGECGLQFRPGRFTLDPSRLMPTTGDVLRRLCPTITTPEGASYSPWTNGWAVGVEARSKHGLRSVLYLNPSGETDEGEGSVFVYQGADGAPNEDTALHWYDPFTQPCPLDWYTVRTDNADRMWRAVNEADARRQHQEAFGGLRGESILAVLMPASPAPARP